MAAASEPLSIMPLCGDLLVALLALVAASHSEHTDTDAVDHAHTDTATPVMKTTTKTPTSPPLSTAMYLPRLRVQEPADPCKAGNYVAFCFTYLRFMSLVARISSQRGAVDLVGMPSIITPV